MVVNAFYCIIVLFRNTFCIVLLYCLEVHVLYCIIVLFGSACIVFYYCIVW